ncbi:MAG: hypothetical protein K6E14_08150 [Paludibacteraceae bacterium]|nr:hypothetical protein [Paludibacteraceae bacterium]
MINNLFQKLTDSRRKVAATLANPATIGLWNLIVDKYSGKAHFVYELLQNADDAGARNVRIVLDGDRFSFFHDGSRQFSVSDVDKEDSDGKIGDINAITSIGHSTKVGENKIGKFGIGFKSIFAYCDVPHVEDDNFSFDIQNFIVPVETKRLVGSGRRVGETLFCGKIKDNSKADEIASMVASLDFPLNYLNNVEELDCSVDGKIYRFKKSIASSKIVEDSVRIYSLISEKTVGQSSMSQNFTCATESFLFGSQQMSATLSMPVDEDGNAVLCDSSALNCFFPLLEQSSLPFFIHGTFLLSDNRENTLQNEANDALRQQIASLSVFFLKHLKSWKTVERVLEMKEKCKYENVNSINRLCSERLYQTIVSGVSSTSFFQDADGAFIPTSALYFCVENVGDILSDGELVTLSKGKVCKDFDKIDLSKFPHLRKLVESQIWGVEAMLMSLDEDFMKQKSEEWIMNFYRFLYGERKVLARLLRGKSGAFAKDWIKCADGHFRSLGGRANLKNLYLSGDASHSVFPSLLDDKEIHLLFADVLQLTHFSEQSLTVDFVAQQFQEQRVSPLDYDTLAKYIMIAANEYVGAGFDFDRKKNIVELFGNLQFLPTNKYTLSLPQSVFAETGVQRAFFADNADAVFLPNDFIEKSVSPSDRQTFYTFVSACGVCFDVRIDCNVLRHPIDYKAFGISDEEMPSPSKLKETEIDDREIVGFNHFLCHPSLDRSLAFCRMLQSLLDKEVPTEVLRRLTGKYRYTPKGKRNSVETTLKNTTAYRQLFKSRWLMKTNGEYASVAEIPSTDMLMPAYDAIPYSVFSFLGISFKKRDEDAEAREALALVRALERVGITKEMLNEMINEKLKMRN